MLQLTSAALTLSQASECKVCFLCVHRGYEREGERERETEARGETGRKERKRARRGRDESFQARRPLNAFLRHLVSPQFRVLNSFNEDQFDHGRPLDLIDLVSGSPSTSSTSIVIVAIGSILTGRSNTEGRQRGRETDKKRSPTIHVRIQRLDCSFPFSRRVLSATPIRAKLLRYLINSSAPLAPPCVIFSISYFANVTNDYDNVIDFSIIAK